MVHIFARFAASSLAPLAPLAALAALAAAPRAAHAQSAALTPAALTPAALTPAALTPDAAPAQRYARGSISFRGGLYFGAHAAYSTTAVGARVAAAPRFVFPSGLVLEPMLAAGLMYGAHSNHTGTGSTVWSSETVLGTATLGVAAGYALALNPRVAITPLVRYTANVGAVLHHTSSATSPGALPGPAVHHALSIELPLTVFLSDHVFIEPALVTSLGTLPSGNGLSLTVGFGHSFGVTF